MIDVHPKLLRTFLAVERGRNITRAAREVHLAQSSVSDQLQALEAELGAALFTRTRHGLVLTAAGETLKSYAEEILALTDEARAAVDETVDQAPRQVTIGALETIAAAKLPRWLSAFQSDHPEVDVQLKVAGSGELLRGLEDGGIDVTFCFDTGDRDGRFSRRAVSAEPLVLVAPPGRQPTPADGGLAALAATRFVATEVGCVYRRMFDDAFAEAGVATPKIAVEAGSIRAIARLVAAGVGLALVPRLAVADALDRGEIVEIPWPAPARAASLVLMWRSRRVRPPALKLLLAAARDGFPPARPADARPRRAAPYPS